MTHFLLNKMLKNSPNTIQKKALYIKLIILTLLLSTTLQTEGILTVCQRSERIHKIKTIVDDIETTTTECLPKSRNCQSYDEETGQCNSCKNPFGLKDDEDGHAYCSLKKTYVFLFVGSSATFIIVCIFIINMKDKKLKCKKRCPCCYKICCKDSEVQPLDDSQCDDMNIDGNNNLNPNQMKLKENCVDQIVNEILKPKITVWATERPQRNQFDDQSG